MKKAIEVVNENLYKKAMAIDPELVTRAMRELDRRQTGWLGVPDSEYPDFVNSIFRDFVDRKGEQK